MTERKRSAVLQGSRLPALLAAFASAALLPDVAMANDAGAKDASAQSSAATGTVHIAEPSLYLSLSVDGETRDDLLRQDSFALPAGMHQLRLVPREGPPHELHIVLQEGGTFSVSPHYCEPRLGGVAPPIEPRPRGGCCGGPSATTAGSQGNYGALAGVALAVTLGRRRKRK